MITRQQIVDLLWDARLESMEAGIGGAERARRFARVRVLMAKLESMRETAA